MFLSLISYLSIGRKISKHLYMWRGCVWVVGLIGGQAGKGIVVWIFSALCTNRLFWKGFKLCYSVF